MSRLSLSGPFAAVALALSCGAAWAGASYDSATVEGCLYVDVDEGGAMFDDARLTGGITNIIKRGVGQLDSVAIASYAGDFTIEQGVYAVATANAFGAVNSRTVDVKDGASIAFSGKVSNPLEGKTVNLYGAPAEGQKGKFVCTNKEGNGGKVGRLVLVDADATLAAVSGRLNFYGGTIDLNGHALTLASGQVGVSGSILNGGTIAVSGTWIGESAATLDPLCPGRVVVKKGGVLNLKHKDFVFNDWALVAEDGSHLRGNSTKFPRSSDCPHWDGTGGIHATGTVTIASYTGGYNVSNTVYEVRAPMFGTGTLKAGPGWLNLKYPENGYAGKVTVDGRTDPKECGIPAGGGGIGLWNGAPCFTNASSVTFKNSARLEIMDAAKSVIPVVTFSDSDDDQSIRGGSAAEGSRSVVAGVLKNTASTLELDTPAEFTGPVDVRAGTLKIANRARYGNAGLVEQHLTVVDSSKNGSIQASTKLWTVSPSEIVVTTNGIARNGAEKVYSGLETPANDANGAKTRHGYWYSGYVRNRSSTNETWQLLADYSNPNVRMYLGANRQVVSFAQDAASNQVVKPLEVTLAPGPTAVEIWMFTWAGVAAGPELCNKLGLSYARHPVVSVDDFSGTNQTHLAAFVQMKDSGLGELFTVDDKDTAEAGEVVYEELPVVNELVMAPGTTLDLASNLTCRIGALSGLPQVVNAPHLALTERWAVSEADAAGLLPLSTDGRLTFAEGCVFDAVDYRSWSMAAKLALNSGVVIATAEDGIESLPAVSAEAAVHGVRLEIGADGKSLKLFYHPDGMMLFLR